MATEGGRYLLMFSTVIAGKEFSRLSFMALMRVDTGGLKKGRMDE